MAEDGGFFGGFPGGALGAGATGLGGIADIYSFIQNLQRQSQMRQIAQIMQDPRKLAAYIQRLYQPMGAAENQAVHRDLGANWSTMTGGAPGGAMNQFVADALAKIESQRYQSAAQNALQSLSGASGAVSGLPVQAMGQMGNILKVLNQLRSSQPRSSTPGLTVPVPNEGGFGDSSGSFLPDSVQL